MAPALLSGQQGQMEQGTRAVFKEKKPVRIMVLAFLGFCVLCIVVGGIELWAWSSSSSPGREDGIDNTAGVEPPGGGNGTQYGLLALKEDTNSLNAASGKHSKSSSSGSRKQRVPDPSPQDTAEASTVASTTSSGFAAELNVSGVPLSGISSDDLSSGVGSKARVVSVEADWPIPRQPIPFAVETLELDPCKRQTGLPLSLDSWPASSLFVISMRSREQVAQGQVRATLAALDAQLGAEEASYTEAVAPETSATLLKSYSHLLPSAALYDVADYNQRLFFAHLEVWARIVEQQIPFALLLEEDTGMAQGSGELREKLKELLVRIKRKRGGGGAAEESRPEEDASVWRRRMQEVLQELNFLVISKGERCFFDLLLLSRHQIVSYAEPSLSPNIAQAQGSHGSHAYIISLRGAKKLLSHISLGAGIADAIWRIPNVRILATKQPLFSDHMVQRGANAYRAAPRGDLAPAGTQLSAVNRTIFLDEEQSRRKEEEGGGSGGGGSSSSSSSSCGTQAMCLGEKGGFVALHETNDEIARVERLTMPPLLSMWRTFAINLKEDGGRFDDLAARMKATGFGVVTRSLAIDTEGVKFNMFTPLITENHVSFTRGVVWGDMGMGGRLSKGEVGCALSHYMIWIEIVAKEIPFAFILEDDATFSDGFRDAFERNVKQINGVMTRQVDPLAADVILAGSIGILPDLFHPYVSDNIQVCAHSWCTYGYIVSLEGAKKLLKAFFINDPIDSFWWRAPDVTFWKFQPALVSHLSQKHGADKAGSRVQGSSKDWRRRR